MASFNSIFDNGFFLNAEYSTVPEDFDKWSDTILDVFIKSIPLDSDSYTDMELTFKNVSLDKDVAIGMVDVNVKGKKVSFPFIVKNYKLSPFDLFIYNGVTYPATPAYIDKLLTNKTLGVIVDEKDLPDSKNKWSLGGEYITDSLSDLSRKISSVKLAKFFKENFDVAEIYYTNKTAKCALEKLMNSIETDTIKSASNDVLSVVAKPMYGRYVKVGYVTPSGVFDAEVNADVINHLPLEISAIAKAAADSSDYMNTITPTQGTNSGEVDTFAEYTKDPISIDGPLKEDSGNMIDWNGKSINYNVLVSKALQRTELAFIKPNIVIVFKTPSGKFTSPLEVKRKVHVNDTFIIRGVDMVLGREVSITLDPKLKNIFEEADHPVKVRMPMDWEIYAAPISKRHYESITHRKTSEVKYARLNVDYVHQTDSYNISGAVVDNHNGSGFSWAKTAAIINYYAGDVYKTLKHGSYSFKYRPKPTYEVTTIDDNYKDDPILLKEAAVIAKFLESEAYTTLVKTGGLTEAVDSVENILSLNHLTSNVIETSRTKLESLENTLLFLADLLLTSRITDLLPEDDIKKCMIYLEKVITSLKHVAMDNLLKSKAAE